MKRHLITFVAASASLFAILLFAAWVLLGFNGSGMGIHGWIAMILGIVVTCGLAIALMAAMFSSDSSGYDSRVVDRRPPDP